MSATRERAEWVEGDERARARREAAADELVRHAAEQVRLLVVEGGMMSGRELFVGRLRTLLEAERAGDREALRAAVMDVAVAAATWVAALDADAVR